MSRQPKFRIWATVWWGYRYAFANPALLLRCGGVFTASWFAIFVATAVQILRGEKISSTPVYVLFFAVLLISYFAVAWHRSILLGEKKPKVVRYVGPELLYALILIVVGPAALLVGLLEPAKDIASGGVSSQWVLYSFLILASAVLYVFVLIILPGIAIEDKNMGLGRAWRLLRGNRWRFFFFVFLSECVAVSVFSVGNKLASLLRGFLWNVMNLLPTYPESAEDWMVFAVTEPFCTLITVVVMLVVLAGLTGSVSISYAGIVRLGVENDASYKAPENLSRHLSV